MYATCRERPAGRPGAVAGRALRLTSPAVLVTLKKLVPWLPALVWAAFLFFMSSIPGDDLPGADIPFRGKGAHAAVDAGPGALCFRPLRRAAPALAPRWAAALAVLIATVYGVTDEGHQAFVPKRSPDY